MPLLSIEITRECPLSCPLLCLWRVPPGRWDAAGETWPTTAETIWLARILDLVARHDPVHVSLVGGEPMIRHRELSRVLPVLSARGTFAMVVTSGVIPIPEEWHSLPRLTIAVSVDGLPPEHNQRRKPATYERILKNIDGRKVNIHCTVVRQQLERDGYLDEFLSISRSRRPEVKSHLVQHIHSPARRGIAGKAPLMSTGCVSPQWLRAIAALSQVDAARGDDASYSSRRRKPGPVHLRKNVGELQTADLRTTVEQHAYSAGTRIAVN